MFILSISITCFQPIFSYLYVCVSYGCNWLISVGFLQWRYISAHDLLQLVSIASFPVVFVLLSLYCTIVYCMEGFILYTVVFFFFVLSYVHVYILVISVILLGLLWNCVRLKTFKDALNVIVSNGGNKFHNKLA